MSTSGSRFSPIEFNAAILADDAEAILKHHSNLSTPNKDIFRLLHLSGFIELAMRYKKQQAINALVSIYTPNDTIKELLRKLISAHDFATLKYIEDNETALFLTEFIALCLEDNDDMKIAFPAQFQALNESNAVAVLQDKTLFGEAKDVYGPLGIDCLTLFQKANEKDRKNALYRFHLLCKDHRKAFSLTAALTFITLGSTIQTDRNTIKACIVDIVKYIIADYGSDTASEQLIKVMIFYGDHVGGQSFQYLDWASDIIPLLDVHIDNWVSLMSVICDRIEVDDYVRFDQPISANNKIMSLEKTADITRILQAMPLNDKIYSNVVSKLIFYFDGYNIHVKTVIALCQYITRFNGGRCTEIPQLLIDDDVVRFDQDAPLNMHSMNRILTLLLSRKNLGILPDYVDLEDTNKTLSKPLEYVSLSDFYKVIIPLLEAPLEEILSMPITHNDWSLFALITYHKLNPAQLIDEFKDLPENAAICMRMMA